MSDLWQAIASWFRSLFGLAPDEVQRVGFLCSVGKNDIKGFREAFEDELNGGPTHTVPLVEKYADGKYRDISGLVAMAKDLMQGTAVSPKVDVIVTAGGVVSLKAAVQAAKDLPNIKIPILFIVGRDLNDSTVQHSNISGGINLDMPRYNADRVAAVRNRYPGEVTTVGLLVNLNAAMGPGEDAAWQQAWGPTEPCGRNEDNDRINLQQAVANLAGKASAIVVSADPYFLSKRATLVAHLNNSGKPACYPFDEYRTAGPGTSPGRSMRFGVGLADQYKALGVKAKSVLAKLVSSPGTIPNEGVTQVQNTRVDW